MGWNTWNKFACNINEELIKNTIDALNSSGLLEAGYKYTVNYEINPPIPPG